MHRPEPAGGLPAPPPRGTAARGRRPAPRAAPAHPRPAARGGRRAVPHVRPTTTRASSRSAARSPSEQMIASIAQGLHLTLDERDHLFRLAGHQPPAARPEQRARQPRHAAHPRPPRRHAGRDRHRARRDAAPDAARGRARPATRRASPGPRAAAATAGSPTPPTRDIYLPEDHAFLSRMYAAGLRGIAADARTRARGRPQLAELLLAAERGVPHPVGRPRDRHRARRGQALPAPRGRPARAATARSCSTPSSRTACWSTPPTPAPRATRSSSCSPSSAPSACLRPDPLRTPTWPRCPACRRAGAAASASDTTGPGA